MLIIEKSMCFIACQYSIDVITLIYRSNDYYIMTESYNTSA